MKIIIAHEDIVMRKQVRQVLEPFDIEIVAEASNGLQAYNKFIEYNPDMILMNLHLPIYDGISALNRIKTYQPDAICVMMGEHFQNREFFKALEIGATHYMVLPLEMARVEKVLHDVKHIMNEMEKLCIK